MWRGMRLARQQGGVARAARDGRAGGALCPQGAPSTWAATAAGSPADPVDLGGLGCAVGQGPLSSEGVCSQPQAGRGEGQTGRAEVAAGRRGGRGPASCEDRLGATQGVRAAGAVRGPRPRRSPAHRPRSECWQLGSYHARPRRSKPCASLLSAESAPQTLQPV